MNTRALVLALLATVALAQPVILPVIAVVRRRNSALGWLLMATVPILAFSSLFAGFIASWQDVLSPAAAGQAGVIASLSSVTGMFSEATSILLLCAFPTVLFAVLRLIEWRDRRRAAEHLAAWQMRRAVSQ